MTKARIASAPADGHGLTDRFTDPAYSAVSEGGSGDDVVVMAILRPVATGMRATAQGGHKTVTYEAVRVEPLRDEHEIQAATYRISELYRERTTPSARPLPLDYDGMKVAQQRKIVLDAIGDWAKDAGMDDVMVQTEWDRHFSDSEEVVGKSWKKAAPDLLREFALDRDLIEERESFTEPTGDLSAVPDAKDDTAAPEDSNYDPADDEPEAPRGVPAADFSGSVE